MLSKNAIRVIKWLDKREDQYFTEHELNQAGIEVEYLTLDWLCGHDYLIRYILDEPYDPDTETPPYEYRISQGGKVKLAELRQDHFVEIRNWITTIIAVFAFIKSFFF